MKGDIVVVFARAPRLGTVKRRLAAGIGARAALRFHARTLSAVLRRLRADGRFAVVLATTPPGARGPWRTAPHEAQAAGDLGRRMATAFARHPRRRMVLVGSDIPELTAADVVAAFRALGTARAVFGPATDGGYWLVGLGPWRPARPFAGVRWSTSHALADTLKNLPTRVAFLRMLRDVDDIDDLRALKSTRRKF